MSDTKYIIFRADTEYESLVAIVEWTHDYANLMCERMAVAEKIHDEDKNFAWMEYFDAAELYESSKAFEEWLDESGHMDDWDKFLFVVSDRKPEFPESDSVRVSMTYVHLDASSCWWEIFPKHSSESVETQPIHTEIKELFG